jgi:hypothetical protein
MSMVQLGLLSAMSAPFGFAIWVAARRWPMPLGTIGEMADATGEYSGDWANSPDEESLDAESVVRAAADDLRDLARSNFVRVEMAVSPGVRSRICGVASRHALRAMVRTAITAAPGGQVLITAVAHGDQILIKVMDDGANTDQTSRESAARSTETLLAPQGGSILVETNPLLGTTVTLWLSSLGDVSPYADEMSDAPDWADQLA